MARTFLNRSDEMWLCNNFCTASNEELATQLNERVTAQNKEEIKHLKEALKVVSQKSTIRSIEREIEWRESFKGITPEFIKHAALRLKCGKKSFGYLSKIGRDKARLTNVKRWQKQAQVVSAPSEWLHSFKRKETRICSVEKPEMCKKMKNAIFYFNQTESEKLGYFISYECIQSANIMRIVANPIHC